MNFDYGIVGSGPAGYTAALYAASTGKKVVLFEKNYAGGVCLNKGCIPTKTLLHSAEIYETNKTCSEMGINITENSFDFTKVAERKHSVIEKLRNGLERSFKAAGVNFINAEAQIIDKNTKKLCTNTFNECIMKDRNFSL